MGLSLNNLIDPEKLNYELQFSSYILALKEGENIQGTVGKGEIGSFWTWGRWVGEEGRGGGGVNVLAEAMV